jgi:hypothetical protein
MWINKVKRPTYFEEWNKKLEDLKGLKDNIQVRWAMDSLDRTSMLY